MLKTCIYLRTLAAAPLLSLLGGCLLWPMEHDESSEDIGRVAATSDGGALVLMHRAIGTCTWQAFSEGRHCNFVSSRHLAKVPGAMGLIDRWELDMDQSESVHLLRESAPGRYELHSKDGKSLRIRTFDENGTKISDELAGPAPEKYNYVGAADSSNRTELADGSALFVNFQAMPATLTHRDPAGQELWTVPDPITLLDFADNGPAGSTVIGGVGGDSWGPVAMRLDAAGTVVWRRDLWTLQRYMK